MKKLLLIIAVLFSFSAYAQNEAGYALHSPKTTAETGSKFTLPILMDNDLTICGLQLDITLPQGFEIAKGLNEDEDLVDLIEKGSRAKSGHTVSSNKIGERQYRVVLSSSTNAEFKTDKTLPVLNVTLDVAADAALGESKIQFTNIIFTNYTKEGNVTKKIEVPDAAATIDVVSLFSVKAVSNNPEKGSVKISGETFDAEKSIAMSGDVLTFEAIPNDGCIFLKWTEDGKDVSTENPYQWTVDKNLNLTAVFAKYSIYSENATASKGARLVLPIFMDNEESISNIQFDITLPQGMDIAKGLNEDEDEVLLITKGDRAKSGHTISCSKVGDGQYRVVISSASNVTFKDTDMSLPVVNVTLDIAKNIASGDFNIALGNMVLSHYDEVSGTSKYNVAPQTVVITIINTFSISAAAENPAHGSVTISGSTYDPSEGTAEKDDELTLTANPAAGYVFWKWVEDGKDVSTDSPYTFTLTGDRSIKAVFTKLGDVYEDGIVDIADLTSIVGIILTGGDVDVRTFRAADVYTDGIIDIADYTSTVGIILNSDAQ